MSASRLHPRWRRTKFNPYSITAGTSTTRTRHKTASGSDSGSKAISAPVDSDGGDESISQAIIDDVNASGGESDREDGPSNKRKLSGIGEDPGSATAKKSGIEESKGERRRADVPDDEDTDEADMEDRVIAENIPDYNPVVKEWASGRRSGCSEDFPVLDDFTFWIEEQSEPQRPFPRALTNFRFVDMSGRDVSVAPGHFGDDEPLRAIGVAASANKNWDSGQRIAAGWWNTDDVTWDRAPMEMLWIEFRVDRIKCGTPAWFRNGKTKALVATSSTAEYVLQAPHPDYTHRWSACALPVAHQFKGIGTTSNRCPKFMDWEYYLELKEDIARWIKDGKETEPELTDISDAEKERLLQEGRAANMEARKRGLGSQL